MLGEGHGSRYAVMEQRYVGREGHEEVGMQFWGLGKGSREGLNIDGLQSQGIGDW